GQFVSAALPERGDGRKLRIRARSEDLYARHAVHCILDRDGDLRLHLGRRQPEAEGLDLHSCRGKFRKDIDRNISQPLSTEKGKTEAKCHDDEAKTQAVSDDPANHDVSLPSRYSPLTPIAVP